jgi:hypothetical protein
MKIEVTTSRWMSLLSRPVAGDRPRHAPAHALPPAESPTAKKIPSHRRISERHATHDRVRIAEVLGARRASTRMRQWLVRMNQAPRIPEVADLLVTQELVWQRGARMVRSPAFGVAAAAYLVYAWVVFGAPTSPPTADGSTAHNADIDPRTALTTVSGSEPSLGHTELPDGFAPEGHIDPQFFAALQKTLGDLDQQGGHDQLKYPQQGVDEAMPLADQPAPESDTSVPEASAIASSGPAVVNPSGEGADAPAPDSSVPDVSAIAPQPPAVVNPSGEAADAISQQPLGPLPGPAA